jgi:regulator of replication initiation timing
MMERNDLAAMKAENDRLMADIEKLKQRLREEISRTQAGVRLELNLEKGMISHFRLPCAYSSFYHSCKDECERRRAARI